MADKILVVDDEMEILEETSEALTEAGYECLCADNVDDALRILRRDSEIALVVTDLKMPGKTGATSSGKPGRSSTATSLSSSCRATAVRRWKTTESTSTIFLFSESRWILVNSWSW